MTVSQSILRDRSREFAKQIVLLCVEIKEEHHVSVLSNQLLRSGTSIGANIHEAQYAQGTKDFISKFEIALKECHETEYWLELLHDSGYLDDSQFFSIYSDAEELIKLHGFIENDVILICEKDT